MPWLKKRLNISTKDELIFWFALWNWHEYRKEFIYTQLTNKEGETKNLKLENRAALSLWSTEILNYQLCSWMWPFHLHFRFLMFPSSFFVIFFFVFYFLHFYACFFLRWKFPSFLVCWLNFLLLNICWQFYAAWNTIAASVAVVICWKVAAIAIVMAYGICKRKFWLVFVFSPVLEIELNGVWQVAKLFKH